MTDLQWVAAVYRHAAISGEAPTRAVESEMGVPRSTAGRWIAAARVAGMLPPASAGQSPRRNQKALAVAQALGVDYDALLCAVRDHAGGDLRVRS